MASRELKVVVLGDSSSARRELGRLDASVDDTGRNVEETQGRLSKFGPAIAKGAAVGGVGLLALSVKAIDAAAEGQKVAAQTGAVIKSTGGAAKVTAEQVADLSGELSDLSRVEDEAIQSGANLLLTFTNIRNEAGEGNDVFSQATRTLLDMSVALGTDVSSSAIQLGKALNDPIAGVSALAEVGVTFTEDQKAVIASMVETGDVAGAQKIILAELNREFGGSAEAAGNAVTPIDDLRIKLGELEEAFGVRLLDAMEDFERGLKVISTLPGDFMLGIEEINKFTDTGKLGAFIDGVRTGLDGVAAAADAAFGAVKRLIALPGKGVEEVLSGGKGDSSVEKGVKGVLKTLPGIGPLIRGIPGFADGGIVPGRKGAPLLAIVHGGERIVSNQQQQASGLNEDEVPFVSPRGAKLLDFANGRATYADGRTYSSAGWNPIRSAGGLRFRPGARLDTSQIDDRRAPVMTPVPRPRSFHAGGVVPGSPGEEVPIIAKAGERVTPVGQSAGSPSIVIAEGAVQINVSGEPDAYTRAWLEQYVRDLPRRLVTEISRLQAWEARGA